MLDSIEVNIPAGIEDEYANFDQSPASASSGEDEPTAFEALVGAVVELCIHDVACAHLSFENSGVGLGGVGLHILANKLLSFRIQLQSLNLNDNGIGCIGANHLAGALERGALAELRRLELRNCMIGEAGGSQLAAALCCAPLEQLDLSGNLMGPKFYCMLHAAPIDNIVEINLAKTCDWPDSMSDSHVMQEQCCVAQALGAVLATGVMTKVDFSGNGLKEASSCLVLRQLIQTYQEEPRATKSKSFTTFKFGRNHLGKSGCVFLAALLRVRLASGVRTLHLDKCWSDYTHMAAKADHSAPLTSIVRAISICHSLTDLNLAFNKLPPFLVRTILHLPQLVRLNLFRCFWFRSTLASALQPSPGNNILHPPAALAELNLGYNQLTPRDVEVLGSNYLSQCPHLRRLAISSNPRVGDAKALAGILTPIAELDLCHLQLNAASLECILASKHVHQCLRHLKIAGNRLGPACGQVFAKFCSFHGACMQLTSLDLGQCRLQDEGLLALISSVAAGGCRNMAQLVLQRNGLTDEIICPLMHVAANLRRLECLSLKHNQIGVQGAVQIAEALVRKENFPRLRLLLLQNNPLAHEATAEEVLTQARMRRPAMQPGLFW
jgi:Ran GTPase-activating protein (RanGAP) involved in mRNA processing and transport